MICQLRRRDQNLPTDFLLLLALFCSALVLRPQIVGVGPLVPRIQAELAVPHGTIGLLTTIPVVCMGLFAPLAPRLGARLGVRRVITASILVLGVFGVVRAVAPGVVILLAATAGLGVPLAIAGALLPAAVKQSYAHRPALGTGAYVAGIQLGSVGSAAAAPVAAVWGGWRGALAVFSVLSLAVGVLWDRTSRTKVATSAGVPSRLPWRSGLVWLLVLVFFLQSVPYYALNAWLPAFLVEGGASEQRAGAVLATMNLGALLGTLTMPLVADRFGSRRRQLVTTSLVLCSAVTLLVLSPSTAWPSAVVIGFAMGVFFPLVLLLPLDVADRPEDVGAVTAVVFGAGYSLAAIAPAGLGAIRDVTGDFAISLWTIVVLLAVLTALCATLDPRRLERGLRPMFDPPRR